ncbi:methylenetetrahydrofolate reductase [Buchnera aphidicola (Chaitoregma tattakana)]|uniref:methylenetetrahydrofolate reductase n=1 Tax=Buchnera aphidicola TaxID=9 RepID=UPI0031B88E4D
MFNINNNINNIYESYINFRNKINISFEMFPPSTESNKENFSETFKKLSKINPSFFSITCNQNLGGNNKTFSLIESIKRKTKIDIVPHVTCIGCSKKELSDIVTNYWNSGVRKILALRGDNFSSNLNSDFCYASDFVYELKKIKNFEILVAAYPEKHPESKNKITDIYNLKRKIDNGANKAITQFFFKIDNYLKFRDKCFSIGIKKEIVPGILPIYDLLQLKRFIKMTNVSVPDWIYNVFHKVKNDSNSYKIISGIILFNIVNKLFKEGVRSFHFYTLNRSDIIYSISHLLKINKINISNII